MQPLSDAEAGKRQASPGASPLPADATAWCQIGRGRKEGGGAGGLREVGHLVAQLSGDVADGCQRGLALLCRLLLLVRVERIAE